MINLHCNLKQALSQSALHRYVFASFHQTTLTKHFLIALFCDTSVFLIFSIREFLGEANIAGLSLLTHPTRINITNYCTR